MFARRTVRVEGTPTAYRLFDAGIRPAPVILFLHGAGESGTDDTLPATVGIGPAIREDPSRFPALVVFPQASRGYGWRGFNLAAAVAALDDVIASFDVDQEQVSVTGISMGGFGTWLLGVQHPERFSALVPVCGGLDVGTAGMNHAKAARRIASIPQWVFHGDADDIIRVEHSRMMVAELQRAGADVRYTEYPGVSHNSWDRAYAEPELMPWLLGQKRTLTPAARTRGRSE